MAPPERSYSEPEVAAILSRAAELSTEAGVRGTSLVELERIAAEAGIDPTLVRRAAAELSSGRALPRSSAWQKLFGPIRLRFETVVAGEITEEAHEAIFDAVQGALNLPGTLNRAGRSFSWSLTNQNRNLSIHVTSRNGQTTVRVEEALGSLAGGIWGGVFGGTAGGLAPVAGILAASALGPIAALAAVVGTIGVAAGGTRAIYGAAVSSREAALSRAFEAVVEAVREQAHHPESALADARARSGLLEAPLPSHADDAAKAQLDERRTERTVESAVERSVEHSVGRTEGRR